MMIRGLLKVIVVGIVGVVLFLPGRYFVTKAISGNQLEQQEKKMVGSVHGANPKVKEIQSVLKGLGLYTGSIDGIIGERTRRAITRLQENNGLPASGFVDAKTVAVLNTHSVVDKKLPVETPSDNVQKARIPSKLGSGETIRKIQMSLAKEGFYSGNIDGKIGTQTKKAIREFQRSKGLKADGVVGPKTWEELSRITDR